MKLGVNELRDVLCQREFTAGWYMKDSLCVQRKPLLRICLKIVFASSDSFCDGENPICVGSSEGREPSTLPNDK